MIAIFRHGETVLNNDRCMQGWFDSPMTDKGIDQVEGTCRHFIANHLDPEKQVDFYCSDLGRSVHSKELFEKQWTLDRSTKSMSLRESSWGLYEGKDVGTEEMVGMLFGRKDNEFGYRPTDGESMGDCFHRVSRFLDINQLRQDNEDVTTIFHVHTNVIRCLLGIYLKLDIPDFMPSSRRFEIDHGNYYVITGNHCQEEKLS